MKLDDVSGTSPDWNPQGSRRRVRSPVAAEVAGAGYSWSKIKTSPNFIKKSDFTGTFLSCMTYKFTYKNIRNLILLES